MGQWTNKKHMLRFTSATYNFVMSWWVPARRRAYQGIILVPCVPKQPTVAQLRDAAQQLEMDYLISSCLCLWSILILSYGMDTRLPIYRKTPTLRFEMNWIMLTPNSETLRGIFGLPGQNQNESLQKTVVMCCHIVARKSVAPSSGHFRHHRRRGTSVDKIRNFEEKRF